MNVCADNVIVVPTQSKKRRQVFFQLLSPLGMSGLVFIISPIESTIPPWHEGMAA